MKQKMNVLLPGLFYLVFGLLFTEIVLRLVMSLDGPAFAPLLTVGVLVLLAVLFHFLGQNCQLIDRYYPAILCVTIAYSFIFQLIAANSLRYETWANVGPVYDLGALYWQAIELAETGQFSEWAFYFYWYPNNLGGLAFIAAFFSLAHRLGISDYYMVAVVVCAAMITATMALSATICKKLMGAKYAVFVMLLFGLTLPIWFAAAIFYSDTLSVLYPILILYLYVKAGEMNVAWKTAAFAVLIGFAAALGTLIKATVLMMLIAIIIDSVFHRHRKQTWLLLTVSVAVVIVLFLFFHALFYPQYLDPVVSEEEKTPFLHWIMMGLNDSGGFSFEDVDFTRSLAGSNEQNTLLAQEILQRILDYGPSGLYKLFWRKMLVVFEDGTFQQSIYFQQNPTQSHPLHAFLLWSGDKNQYYLSFCQVIRMASLALMALSGLQDVREWCRRTTIHKQKQNQETEAGLMPKPVSSDTWDFLAPRIAVFGVVLFLGMWEVSGRYIFNYFPVILICATMGIDSWSRIMRRFRRWARATIGHKKRKKHFHVPFHRTIQRHHRTADDAASSCPETSHDY